MKHAMLQALLITLAPGVDWFERLPRVWKSIMILAIVLLAGVSIGGATATVVGIPESVKDHEERISALEEARGEEQCLLRRLICRLDGGTANSCDLRFRTRDGQCNQVTR